MPRALGRVGVCAMTLMIGACASPAPRINFALEARLMRETTLEDLPDGQSSVGDAIVRVQREGGGACTGFLVSPRHVVTAQHCVVAISKKGEMTLDLMVAGQLHVELGGDYLPWGRVGVRKVTACGGWTGKTEGDVAVLTLRRAVPTEVMPLDVSFDALTPGSDVRSRGFGSNDKLSIPLTRWPVQRTRRHARAGTLLYVKGATLLMDMPSEPGDSGSPVIDASGRVIGVASHATSTEGKSKGPASASSDFGEEKPDYTSAASLASCQDAFVGVW